MQRKFGLVLTLAVLSSFPVSAHHGVSAYDMAKMTTVKGTVAAWEFTNPHVMLRFDVKDDKGNIEKWSAETQGPNMLTRSGWSKYTFKPGDQITVIGHRSKTGAPTMRLEKVVLPDGKELAPYPY